MALYLETLQSTLSDNGSNSLLSQLIEYPEKPPKVSIKHRRGGRDILGRDMNKVMSSAKSDR